MRNISSIHVGIVLELHTEQYYVEVSKKSQTRTVP